jgi:hypothetical protein
MKSRIAFLLLLVLSLAVSTSVSRAQPELDLSRTGEGGWPPPIPVSISGFTGEVDSVLKNDLLFMGIKNVSPEQAKFLITGNNNGRVEGRVIERINKNTILAKAYTGGTQRTQTHALADDIAMALTGKPGIAQTKISFKVESGPSRSEIYVADYDGHNSLAVTRDQTIVVGIVYAPSLIGGRASAVQAAEQFKAISGPNHTSFQTEIISADALAQFANRVDAVFLLPGTSKDQVAIVEFLRRRHLVSISNDPACMDAKCCVLMIRTVGGVEIVLDTQLAEAVGAHFSSVFTMMVKRR